MGFVYACILLCIVFVFVGYCTEKRVLFNPITMFCGIWFIIMLFSSLQYYTMEEASDRINQMIFLGIIMYIIGYYSNKFIFGKIHIKIWKYTRHYYDTHYIAIPRYNLLYILGTLCLLFTLYSLLNVIGQVGTFNLGTIQKLLQSGEYENTNIAILNAISMLIISPIRFVLPAITAVDFWYGKKDKKLLGITACLIFVNMLSSANRTSFLLFFVWLIVVAWINLFHKRKGYNASLTDKHYELMKKIKKYIWLLLGIGVVAFVFMTWSRGTSSIFRQLYLYFSMEPRMFEIWADKVDADNVYGYGVASTLGFIYPICYFFKNLLGFKENPYIVQLMYDWTMLTDTLWVWPGKNIYANAYVSIFWFFYLDGRIWGIILGMFGFGCIVSRAYNNVIAKKHSARQVAIYCLILYTVLFSYVRFQFTLSKVALGILFVIFLAYKMVPTEGGNE